MEGRLAYKFRQLNNALEDFCASLDVELASYEPAIGDILKSGQVQKFEFTIELLWKVLKVFLFDFHGFDEKSPKLVVKRFFLLEYVSEDDYERLMGYLDDRNLLSHTYDKEQFEKIYDRIVKSKDLFRKIQITLGNQIPL